jgi:hypothetical protein
LFSLGSRSSLLWEQEGRERFAVIVAMRDVADRTEGVIAEIRTREFRAGGPAMATFLDETYTIYMRMTFDGPENMGVAVRRDLEFWGLHLRGERFEWAPGVELSNIDPEALVEIFVNVRKEAERTINTLNEQVAEAPTTRDAHLARRRTTEQVPIDPLCIHTRFVSVLSPPSCL